jgi:hypothetical protein
MRRSILLMAGGLAACAGNSDHTATDSQKLIGGTGLLTANTSMPIGTGYTTGTDEKRNRCVTLKRAATCGDKVPEYKVGAEEGKFEFELVSSRKELKDKLGVDANVSIRYKLIEGSGALNVEQESEFTASTITFVLRGEESYWTDINDGFQPELTEEAFKKLNKPTQPIPEQFFQSCGDGWVEGFQNTAQLTAILTIEAGSKANRDSISGKISGKLDAGVMKIEGGAALNVVNIAKASNARVTLKAVARGFNWLGHPINNKLIADAIAGDVKPETLTKLADLHGVMQESIANDRCFDQKFKRAVKKPGVGADAPPTWECSNEGADSLGKFAIVSRLHVNDYAAVNHLPDFTEEWNPLRDYPLALADAKGYIASLQFLEDALYTVFLDEIRPYQRAVAERRKEFGLAPPLLAPPVAVPATLEELNKRVDEAAGVFAPPGGRAFERVRSARLTCLNGISLARFTGCKRPDGTPASVGNRWIAALEPYRESWHDLFNYRERFRVLPLQLEVDAALKTYDDAFAACAGKPGVPRMILDGEIDRATLRIAGANAGRRHNSAWYQPTDLSRPERRCPRAYYTVEQKRTFVKPLLERDSQGRTAADCWPADETARVLCVPQGGLFDGYREPLQGLLAPPPLVDTILPPPPSLAPNAFVPPTTHVVLFFRVPLKPSSVSSTSFTLRDGATAVVADVSYADAGSGGRVEMVPRGPLTPGKEYTVEVAKTVTSIAGDAMQADYQSKFRVTNMIKTSVPADQSTGIILGTPITVTFGSPVNPESVTGTTVRLTYTFINEQQVEGKVTYNNATNTATFTPNEPLVASTRYRIRVSGVLNATSASTVPDFESTFTTGAVVNEVVPDDGATGVQLRPGVRAEYTGQLHQTIAPGAFTLKKGTTAVAANVIRNGLNELTLVPDADLEPNTVYTAKVTTAVKDISGNAVLDSKTWTFTTGPRR